MDAERRIFKNGAVVVEDNKIVAVGRTGDLHKHNADVVIDAKGKAVLPGIVNAHTHVVGCVFRGMLSDHPGFVFGDISKHPRHRLAFPIEANFTASDVYHLSRLGCLETMKFGSTTINDLFHYMEETAKAVEELGLRAQLATKVLDIDISTVWKGSYEPAQDNLKKNVALIENWHNKANGRITCRVGPHATETCSTELLLRAKEVAKKYKVGIHTHVAQTAAEIKEVKRKTGKTSVEYLNEIGFLGPEVAAAHLIHITDREVGIIAKNRVKHLHCPQGYLLRGGPTRLMDLLGKGVVTGIGTDWLYMDPFEAMRSLLGAARTQTQSNTTFDPYTVLQMCTMESARALGLENQVGSLESGKKADIILVDMKKPHLTPVYDVVPNLIYNANGNDVETIIIDGKIVQENYKVKGVDEKQIVEKGQEVAEALWNKTGVERIFKEIDGKPIYNYA